MKFKIFIFLFTFLVITQCNGMEKHDFPALFPESIDDYVITAPEQPSKLSVLKSHDEATEEAVNDTSNNSLIPLYQRSSQELLRILQHSEILEQLAILQCREQFQEKPNANGTKRSAIIYVCLKCYKSDLISQPELVGHLRSYHGISRKEFLENKKKYAESKKVFIG